MAEKAARERRRGDFKNGKPSKEKIDRNVKNELIIQNIGAFGAENYTTCSHIDSFCFLENEGDWKPKIERHIIRPKCVFNTGRPKFSFDISHFQAFP